MPGRAEKSHRGRSERLFASLTRLAPGLLIWLQGVGHAASDAFRRWILSTTECPCAFLRTRKAVYPTAAT